MNQTYKTLTLTFIVASSLTASLAQQQWTGQSTTSLNWSDAVNWSSGSAPSSSSTVYFEDQLYTTGYTNAAGLVNNIIDTSAAAGSANYTALSTPFSTNIHCYTTFITSGNTLTLGGFGAVNPPALDVGDVLYNGTWLTSGSQTNYTSITGPGTLNVNDASSKIYVSLRNRATLDLTGLNMLAANVSNIWIGVTPDNTTTTAPNGWLFLAKTNTITTAANLNAPGILLGHGTNASGLAYLLLGATNQLNTDGLVVGGRRSSSGNLLFGAANSNTLSSGVFTLRGSAGGSSPVSLFSIGDDSANYDGYATAYAGTSSSAIGVADFSGGKVDILANNIFIGRGATNIGVAQSGSGTGTLILEHGLVTANNVFVGIKQGTNATTATGTLLLKGDVVMNVANNVSLSYRTNAATGATGTLIVSNGAVLNIGGNLFSGNAASTIALAGSSAINIAGNVVGTGTNVGPSLNMFNGKFNVAGGGNLYLSTFSGYGSITNAANVYVTNSTGSFSLGYVLPSSGGSAFIPGTLDISGNLVVYTNVSGPKFKLGSSLTPGGGINDYLYVRNNLTVTNNKIDLNFLGQPAIGSYDLVYYAGTETGSFLLNFTNTTRNYTFGLDYTTPNHIKLNVGGGPGASVTWKGGVTGVWDITNSLNWNNNTDKFYSYDNVLFDDTGAQTIVTLSGSLSQGGMVFNNSAKTYTLYDGGSSANKIGGFGGLTKNGSGIVVMDLTGSGHDWLGNVNLNQGTLQFQNNSSAGGQQLGATNKLVTIASGATMDLYGTTVGSSGSIGYPINFAGSGVGGAGAITHSKIASGGSSLYSPTLTLTGDASVSVAYAGNNLTLSGINFSSTLNLGGYTLATAGNGNIYLSSLVATNAGNIQVNAPILSLRDVFLDGAGTLNIGSKTLALGTPSGTAWGSTFPVNKTISVAGGTIWASASGGVTIPVGSAVNLAGSLTISNNQAIRMAGNVSGAYGVTKQGLANLILAGTNTYSGPTLVSAGGLVLDTTGTLANSSFVNVFSGATMDVTAKSGSYTIPSGQTVQIDGLASGNFTVPSGSTLDGSGACPGSVVVNGGSIIPGIIDYPRTLSCGSLTLNNATSTFELNSAMTVGGNVNDLIAVTTGNLNLTGTTTIKIVPIGPLNTSGGQYTLFTYAGTPLPSSITNNIIFVSDTHYLFSIVDPATTPGSIQISASISGGSAQTLTWLGGVSPAPSTWDINATTNWLNSGGPISFFNGDSVLFDDTAVTNTVILSGSLRPAAITMANNSASYTFQGSGSLRAGSLSNSGAAGLVIANSADNLLTGAGLALNSGTTTFNQPINAKFTATTTGSGGGALDKEGTNTLIFIGDNGSTLYAPISVNNGTLAAGWTNAFGNGVITVTNSATVDVGGQMLPLATVAVSGSGVGGVGAINNTGLAQTNALSKVVLNDDTIFGALNRWDVAPGGSFQGNNHNLTKVGAGDVWIGPGSDTGLGNVNISTASLVFSWPGTDLGSTGLITVQSNAILAFCGDISAGLKPTTVMPGGIIAGKSVAATISTGGSGSYSTNYGQFNAYSGDITFNGGGIVTVANLAGLNLAGGIHGSSGLTNFDVGLLTISGSNDYSGALTVNYGSVYIASSNALPVNCAVTLNEIPLNGNVFLSLVSNTVTPVSVPLNMICVRQPSGPKTPVFNGNGTWNGPINVIAQQLDPSQLPQVTFQGAANTLGGSNRLSLNGVITQSGTTNVAMNISGGGPGTVAFNQPLSWSGHDGLGR